jgi:hypothetical protein
MENQNVRTQVQECNYSFAQGKTILCSDGYPVSKCSQNLKTGIFLIALFLVIPVVYLIVASLLWVLSRKSEILTSTHVQPSD